ncbi:solute carrier family 40 member 1-like protein, partial [Leptotrombidium deliense]
MKIKCSFNEKNRVKKSIKVEENEGSLPKGIVYKLCLNRVLSSWGDRTWEFATGLLLIKLYPESLLLAAIQGILNSVAVIIFSPVIGRWIEKSPRLREAKVTLFIQNGAVICSSFFASLYFKRNAIENDSLREIITQGAPIAFVLFSVVGQVFSCGYTLVLEKDWLLALVSNNQELTHLNALLRQIDLSCQTVAPFLVGFLTQYSEFATASFLCCWNVISTTAEYLILRNIYYTGPQSVRNTKSVPQEHELKIFDLLAIKEYCSEFLLPGLGFALLYLTVLGFDSVTIGFLVTHAVSDSLVGAVSLCAGLFGIFGTRLFKECVEKCGLKVTGQLGFILNLACVAPCLTM